MLDHPDVAEVVRSAVRLQHERAGCRMGQALGGTFSLAELYIIVRLNPIVQHGGAGFAN
jgi:hypothetical protein